MALWHKVKSAIEGSTATAVRGTVVAYTEQTRVNVYTAGGVPVVFVAMPSTEVTFQRVGRRFRIECPVRGRLYICDGQSIWDFRTDQQTPTVGSASAMKFVGPGNELVGTTSGIDSWWGRGFPSGPVSESRFLDRAVWVVPGTLDSGAAEIVVDQGTGVLLAVRSVDSTWRAEFTAIEFPDRVDPGDFDWDGATHPAQSMQLEGPCDPAPVAPMEEPMEEVVAPPSPVDPRARILPVRFVAEDGNVTSLAVGQTVEWHLRFNSVDTGTPATATVHARAMPPRATRATPAEGYEDGELRWPTTLRGDGWSAHWEAPRPTIGPIEVTGELENDTSAGIYGQDFEPATRGRIRRMRVLVHSVPGTPHDRTQNSGGAEGSRRWIDVQAAPDMGFGPARPTQFDARTRGIPEALIVDLDLDAAAPAFPRGRHKPGDAVAHGRSMWSADAELPIVARLDLTVPLTAAEFILPLPVNHRSPWDSRGGLRLFPDHAGCWVISRGSLFRLSQDGGTELAMALPEGSLAASSDGTTLLIHGPESFVVRADGSTTAIALPHGSARDLLHPVVDPPGEYLALLRDPASESVPIGYHYRPARIFSDGTVLAGPVIDLGADPEAIGLVGGTYWLVTRQRIHLLDDTLHPDVVRPLPPGAMSSGFIEDQMWIITHRPHPLDNPDWRAEFAPSADHPGVDDPYLLVMLDLPSLQPQWAMPVGEHHPRVSKDDYRTVWVTTSGLRGRRPDGTISEFDVSALLDAADQ